MSMPAPEQQPARANPLTQKIGPLSTWVWLLIVTFIVGGIALYLRKRQAKQSPAATTGTAQVPDIILQNFDDDGSGGPPVQGPPPTIFPPRQPHPKPPKRYPVTHPGGRVPNGGLHFPTSRHPKGSPPQLPVFNGSYTVKAGQTLDDVAAEYGISREELAHANGFGTGAGLRTGEKLRVPSPGPHGRPNPAP